MLNNTMESENCSTELKEYRSLYSLVKHMDEQKKQIITINQLFQPEINQKRLALIQRCHALLFKGNQVIGKKTREILWRKGYYEFIAFVKKNYHKEDKSKQNEWMDKLRNFLLEGITNYKKIILKMEKAYDLDLQLLIDFSIINDHENYNNSDNNYNNDKFFSKDETEVQKSLEAVGFALDTIHSSLLSIGDLNRYYLDFKFNNNNENKSLQTISEKNISKELAARYYYQAFQLNSTIGMAQNQLGTLFYGQNYDLDSIYHYLYSLICTVPFELSETNVCKLFIQHSDYLEELNPNKVEFNLRDFYARFYLIIDIYFFDKNVPDFNNLCHCVLIDLKKILCSKTININEKSIFKIICILLFCMSKLKMINSQKMYSLNAFLVAVCSNLIDSCIVNLEQYILSKSKENDEFQENYTNSFNNFEANVRKSREEYKIFMNLNKNKNDKKEIIKNNITTLKDKTTTKLYNDDIIDICKSQKTSQQSSVGDVKYTPSSSSDQGGGSGHRNYKNNQNDDIDDDHIIKVTLKSSDDSQFKSSINKIHNKKKIQHAKLRRRRRQKIIQSDDDDDDDNSSFDSDSELDTDFSSDDDYDGDDNDYDDNESDLSSNFESDFSDMENLNDDDNDEDHENIIEKNKNEKFRNQQKQDNFEPITNYSDNEDMIIEEEHIIYPNDPDSVNKFIEHFNNLNIVNDLHFKNENSDDENFMNSSRISIERPSSSAHNQIDMIQIINDDDKYEDNVVKQEPPIKLKYKNRYSKIDPNIIIDFSKTENTIRALKILFDWLRINNEILIGCYHTNPEFIHKIMKLLNYCNIDIFTRKVYFERDFIKVNNVREKLDDLFSIRSTIPLSEDMILKGFDLLKQTQSTLDWETPIRDKITENEENFLRIFKMVDFGFFICKLKKFNYNFCSKTRRFTENLNMKKKHDKKKLTNSRKRDRKLSSSSKSRNNKNNHRQRSYNDYYNGGGGGDYKSSRDRQGHRNNEYKNLTQDSNEHKNLEVDNNCVITSVAPRKGYLRNRNSTSNISAVEKMHHQLNNCSSDEEKKKQQQNEEQQKNNDTEEKCRLMGRLWLKNEVETLEAKLKKKPIHVVLTPFIVVDAKALTEYTGIVKALVKSKQFIVLIPNAVLGELDQLKKQSDCARNAIRWLEQEFKVGNRHMRAQRDHESQSLLLIKIPKKLDRESSTFIQIAKFCNFIVANHSEGSDYEANLVTFLSGDHLNDKKSTNLSFTGILDAIPVRHDQISNFYEKFKKK